MRLYRPVFLNHPTEDRIRPTLHQCSQSVLKVHIVICLTAVVVFAIFPLWMTSRQHVCVIML